MVWKAKRKGEEIKKQSEDNKELLDALSKALEGKVKKVELTGRLKTIRAACVPKAR